MQRAGLTYLASVGGGWRLHVKTPFPRLWSQGGYPRKFRLSPSLPLLEVCCAKRSFSFQAAFGWEEDGKTTLRFTRTLKGNGKSDWDFGGKMTLIWVIIKTCIPVHGGG